jgi:hypothetical protein
MTSEAILPAPMPLSRPKVHRLPAPSRPQKVPVPMGVIFSLLMAGVVVIMIVSRMFMGHGEEGSKKIASQSAISPVSEAVASVPEAQKMAGNTIYIKDQNSGIVGQMAKIPAQNEQITEIKAVSNVDKHAARDLLSIINKY